MLEVRGLTQRFASSLLFEDVNLKLNRHNRYGLIGANGAGKSTFLKILSGAIEPTSGEIIIENGLKVGVLGQDQFAFENFTLKDAVLYGNKRLYDAVKEKEKLYMSEEFTDEINERLSELEMISAEEDPSYEYETRIEKILSSLGLNEFDKLMSEVENSDKVKVLLAQVLFPKPDILFLDEPTNGLDPDGIHQMRQLIRSLPQKFNMTILISSHILSEIENLADTVGIIKDGHLIYEGGINQLFNQEQKYQLKVNNLEKAAQIIQHYDNKIGIVKNDDDILLISLPDCTLVPDLIAQLVYNELQIYEIYGVKKTLESVFLDLTKE